MIRMGRRIDDVFDRLLRRSANGSQQSAPFARAAARDCDSIFAHRKADIGNGAALLRVHQRNGPK
jgi:hypothetical protein